MGLWTDMLELNILHNPGAYHMWSIVIESIHASGQMTILPRGIHKLGVGLIDPAGLPIDESAI